MCMCTSDSCIPPYTHITARFTCTHAMQETCRPGHTHTFVDTFPNCLFTLSTQQAGSHTAIPTLSQTLLKSSSLLRSPDSHMLTHAHRVLIISQPHMHLPTTRFQEANTLIHHTPKFTPALPTTAPPLSQSKHGRHMGSIGYPWNAALRRQPFCL